MKTAYARVKGTKNWRPVLFGGLRFYAGPDYLEGLVKAMREAFPQNEYEVRPA